MSNLTKRFELTELQQNFLEALFGEAQGDPKKAKELAGYADSVKAITIVRALRQEINEIAMDQLAMGAPKAALALTGLVSNPTQGGADIMIKAAKEVLDRTGVMQKTDDVTIKVGSGGGLFILPAKRPQEQPTIDLNPGDYNEEEV